MKIDFKEEHPFFYFGAYPLIPYPMVPVRLIGRHGQVADTYALLDSGADCCMFHARWAKKIGLDLHSGRYDCLHGIDPDAGINVYYHRINLIIGSVKIRCDVAFSEDIGDEMNDQLIGRAIVFNKMRFAIRQKVLTSYSGSEI